MKLGMKGPRSSRTRSCFAEAGSGGTKAGRPLDSRLERTIPGMIPGVRQLRAGRPGSRRAILPALGRARPERAARAPCAPRARRGAQPQAAGGSSGHRGATGGEPGGYLGAKGAPRSRRGAPEVAPLCLRGRGAEALRGRRRLPLIFVPTWHRFVLCGSFQLILGDSLSASLISFRIAIMASQKRSISALLSLSVGSIIMVPATGNETVGA